jgi:hypothetical protein
MKKVIADKCPCGNDAKKGCALNSVPLCPSCYATVAPMGTIRVSIVAGVCKGVWTPGEALMRLAFGEET